jgi:hypothetical protein
MLTAIRTILLAEDNENDMELTLAALRTNRLANDVVVVRDGAEALDYLYRRGRYADRAVEHPDVVKPVEFTSFMEAVSALGQFWAVINEAPPATPAGVTD